MTELKIFSSLITWRYVLCLSVRSKILKRERRLFSSAAASNIRNYFLIYAGSKQIVGSKMSSKPKTYERLMVQKLTTNFREAVSIETTDMCHPQKGQICVKNKFVGVNASDVNKTKGRYFGTPKVPFGIGFEGVGEIIEVGEGVKDFAVGQCVAYMSIGGSVYAEYVCLSAFEAFPIPEATPEYLVLLVSGLTAAIGLDKAGRATAKETVLITAAAGGTGHIAVQWAKAADCHVIATCSSEEKANLLKGYGCDRIINYKTEDIGEVLAKEYPKGVDVVWETIGGKVFEDCFKNLAVKGRLVIVGGITGYKSESKGALPALELSYLPEQLLFKSAAVIGFFMPAYSECRPSYFKHLSEQLENRKLRPMVDNGEKTTGAEFIGMEGIIKGVEHLHSGKSIGKVIVRIF